MGSEGIREGSLHEKVGNTGTNRKRLRNSGGGGKGCIK
jgi:hypothetical protein